MTFIKFKKFIASLKSISLGKNERETLRRDFLQKTGLEHVASPYPYFLYSVLHYCKVVAYSFVLFFMGIVPLAFAASVANPGDPLYPIKVVINEPLKAVLKKIIEPILITPIEDIDMKIKENEHPQSDSILNNSEDKNKNDDKKDEKVEKNSNHTKLDIDTNLNTPQKEPTKIEIETPDIQKIFPNVDTSLPKKELSETQVEIEVKENIDLSL
jgi:hypothetical protein